MIIDISPELSFRSSRSGGAGGQNVNKVETAVSGSWDIAASAIFTNEQKALLFEKLANRINADGLLSVRSQVHRTQLANKEEVIKKINRLVENALEKKKPRIATRPSKRQKEKRLEGKRILSQKKTNRKTAGWD